MQSEFLVFSPQSVLHNECAEGEETTDNQSNTNVCGVLFEQFFQTLNAVLLWRSISDWSNEPEQAWATDTIAVHLLFKHRQQIYLADIN